MIIDDYECPACGKESLDLLVDSGEVPTCEDCSTPLQKVFVGRHLFNTIIPDYPGAKRRKAGYVHQYVNRPAEKIQSGYGGTVSNK